jgi:hypothetical protein
VACDVPGTVQGAQETLNLMQVWTLLEGREERLVLALLAVGRARSMRVVPMPVPLALPLVEEDLRTTCSASTSHAKSVA